MRFIKLELTGAPAVELPLHRRMTVVGADGDAERLRLAEALAGRARDGVVWAFDDEDPSEEQVPIGDFGILGLGPDVASAMLLRTHDIPAVAAAPLQLDPASVEAAAAAEAEAESKARARLDACRARLAARPAPDADTATETAIQRALTELQAAEEYAGAAADDARRIAAEWDEVATSLATSAPSDEALATVEAARMTLAERREELASARLAVGNGPISPEAAARIGHLHAEVTSAQSRVDRPFPGPAARRRLAEAEAAETKFLQELGFSSYSAYLLDAVVRPVDPEPLRRLSNAERGLAEAEAAWREVAPVADGLHAHQALQRQAARLRDEAASLLGFDPGDAVAERLALWPECCPRLAETRAGLERELGAAGVAPDLDPAATAQAWLAARRAEASEHAALAAELADIEAELAALQRAAADRAAQVEAQQAAAEAARNAEGESLAAYLHARLAVHRHVGPIGSLPLILEDAFADIAPAARIGGLARLAEMSDTVQVVYLTTDPDVLAWAATMGSDHVDVQRPAPMVPSIPAPAPAPPPPPAPYVAPAPTPAPLVPPAPTPAPAPAPYVPPAATPAPPVPPAPTPAAPPPPAPYVPPAPTPAPPPPYVPPAPAAPAESAAGAGASGPPASGARCTECHHDLAVGDCHQCRASFCGDHLVRMKRNSRPPLCLSCALVAAGARRGRR